MAVDEGAGGRLSGETGTDDLRDMRALLLRRRGYARNLAAVDGDVRGIADHEDVGHAGNGQVGLDDHPAGTVGRRLEPAGGLRGLHAGGPDHRPRWHRLVADTDAGIVAVGDGGAAAHLGAEPGQRVGGIGREPLGEGRQDPGTGLDEEHAGLAGIDVAELAGQRLLRQLGDDAGELDAGGTAADDAEGHQRPAPLAIGLALGLLEGEEQAPADRRRVLEGLEAGGRGLPLVVAEIGVAGAGGEDEGVIGHLAAVGQQHPAPRPVDAGGAPEQGRHLRAVPEQPADRPGDLRRGEQRRRDLVEQGLEQVVVALIDDGDPHRGAPEVVRELQPGETRADDDHVVIGHAGASP